MNFPRCFAVIPAAGRSRRMGAKHKLLLPWQRGTIIDHVLDAWIASRIERVVVVSRADDTLLHQRVRRFPGVELLTVDPPPHDMKGSVLLGLRHFTAAAPDANDRWLIAPADLPTLSARLIDHVIRESGQTTEIVVPSFTGRRGHPVSFPWSLADEVARLGEDEGINRLCEQHPLRLLPLDNEPFPEDVDTEQAYQQLRSNADFDSPSSNPAASNPTSSDPAS